MTATIHDPTIAATFADYVAEVNVLLRSLDREEVPLHLARFDAALEIGWRERLSANDCVVKMAYIAACRKADRNF